MNSKIMYLVKVGPDGEKKEDHYYGYSLIEAYKTHDEIVKEIRLTGPITNISVQKEVLRDDGGLTKSFLQITQINKA